MRRNHCLHGLRSAILCRSLILLVLSSCWSPAILAGEESEWIQSAIDEYTAALDTTDRRERESRFSRAETLFNQAIESGNIASADLYTNLGNAAFQAKRLGPAIAAYRQALKISPSHRRARTNLLHARQRLPEANRYVDADGLFDSLFFWNGLYSPSTIASWAALAFLCAAVLIAVSIFTGHTIYRNFALLPLIGWGILLASWIAASNGSARREAVVIAPEVIARTADSVSSAPRFTNPLPGGTEARVLERREKWTQIQVANDRTAWVPSSSLHFLDES